MIAGVRINLRLFGDVLQEVGLKLTEIVIEILRRIRFAAIVAENNVHICWCESLYLAENLGVKTKLNYVERFCVQCQLGVDHFIGEVAETLTE